MPIDSHCHIQFRAYDADRPAVIKKAKDLCWKMIAVGTNYKTSSDAIAVAHENPGWVYATVGLHPAHLFSTFVDEMEEGPEDSPGGIAGADSAQNIQNMQKRVSKAEPKNLMPLCTLRLLAMLRLWQ